MKAAFDTGSSNTWVLAGAASPTSKSTINNTRGQKEVARMPSPGYTALNSKTAQKTPQEAAVSFGSGALKGHFYIDEMRLGPHCDSLSLAQSEER